MKKQEALKSWEDLAQLQDAFRGRKSNRKRLECAVRAAIEPLEQRLLLSFSFSAAAISSSEIDLTYSSNSGQTLELEQFKAGDLNYHEVTAFSPNYASGSHTYAVTGLSSSSHYS